MAIGTRPARCRRKFLRFFPGGFRDETYLTRVLTWPLVSVFGIIAKPRVHVFLKPTVTRAAAAAYGFGQVRADTLDLEPRDMIDIQSFMWVMGSSGYD